MILKNRRFLLLFAVLGSLYAFQRFPVSEKLVPDDSKEFYDEVHRLERMLETAGDKTTVMYALARTWAAGGQYREAMDLLAKTVALNVGLDPSRDSIFAKLRGTAEFESVLQHAVAQTPPILNGRVAFTIDEADLIPEGIAYDARRKVFYLGSTSKRKIVRCTLAGVCKTFATEGLGEVLGLKVNPADGTLWAASNTGAESRLFHFLVPSGKPIRKYAVSQKPDRHVFNDLVINAAGDAFVTDTQAGSVYWVSHLTDRLELLNPELKVDSANGIALSDDGAKLYVAGFGAGITVVDLPSGSFHPIAHPANLCLATIDGLYFSQGSLIAIQNGIMTNRVVRFHLTPDLNEIDRFDILERRNPFFDGITTGAIANGSFYFMANTQDDRKANFQPIKILKLDLAR